MRQLLRHLENIGDQCEGLGYLRGLFFCLACCERQFFVYRKSPARTDRGVEAVRSFLDSAWNGVASPIRASAVEKVASASGAENYFLRSVDIVSTMTESNWRPCCDEVSGLGMKIVDALTYDILRLPVSENNDCIVDSLALVQVEMNLQNRDAAYLLKNPEVGGLDAFKNQAKKDDITLGCWGSELED